MVLPCLLPPPLGVGDRGGRAGSRVRLGERVSPAPPAFRARPALSEGMTETATPVGERAR